VPFIIIQGTPHWEIFHLWDFHCYPAITAIIRVIIRLIATIIAAMLVLIVAAKILIAIIIAAVAIIKIIIIIAIMITITQTFKGIKDAIIIASITRSYQTKRRNQFHSHYCWELTAGIITVVKETDYYLQKGSPRSPPQILLCSLAKTSRTATIATTAIAAKWSRNSAAWNYPHHSRHEIFLQTPWVFITRGYLIQACLNIAWKAIQTYLDTTA